MRKIWLFAIFTVVIMAAGYLVGPLVHPYLGTIKQLLVEFKRFCQQDPIMGYITYGMLLSVTILLGLPFATLIMLLAGVTYNFWEATLVVTTARLAVALAAFLIVRHLFGAECEYPRYRRKKKPKPVLLEKFEHHPQIALFLARLAPLPDTTVNYAMGASSIRCLPYAAISLIGMIPITLLLVWIGNSLGSISKLMNMLN